MKDWKKTLAKPHTSIREVIEIIDNGAFQIALIVDDQMKLLGTVTDGDIRRAILHNVPMNERVEKIMKDSPIVAKKSMPPEQRRSLMRERGIQKLPLLDGKGIVVGLQGLEEDLEGINKENWVVLMAGGYGSRLRPLTEECPKPLLKVGSKPILETILQNFIQYGFRRFFISINYKGEMLESFFGDGSKWGVQIEYIREDENMGTAGALSLFKQKPENPFIVMNGDILTKVNFDHLLEFHSSNQSVGTMCVRQYDFQVPYGVVELEKNRITKISEKPIQFFFVNAGIYVLNPEVLEFLPDNTSTHMTTLFETCIEKNAKTLAFPIREYWLDIGQMEDFKRANGEFGEVFGK